MSGSNKASIEVSSSSATVAAAGRSAGAGGRARPRPVEPLGGPVPGVTPGGRRGIARQEPSARQAPAGARGGDPCCVRGDTLRLEATHEQLLGYR